MANRLDGERLQIAPISIGVTIAVLLLGVAASPGNPLLFVHKHCVGTGFLAQEELLTPRGVSNTPYAGFLNYTAIWNPSWAPGTSVRHYSPFSTTVEGDFEAANWSIFNASTELIGGPGPNQACSSSWIAVLTSWDGKGLSGDLWNATPSDVNSPSTISDGNLSSVAFDISFHVSNDVTVDTCGTPAARIDLHSTTVKVFVPFTVDGRIVSLPSSVPVQLFLNYTFPGNSGTWLVDNLNAGANAAGTGIATVWTHC